MRKKRDYKFHSDDRVEWPQEWYKKFFEGLYKFCDLTINNKKIAKYMNPSVKPNHVRYIKGKYLKNVKKRSKSKKCTMKEIIKSDIDNFDGSIIKKFNIFSKDYTGSDNEEDNKSDENSNNENSKDSIKFNSK